MPGPPTWEVLHKWEANLPQHDLDLPFPEGRTGRYVKFSNQNKGLGWNNCLNEELMNLHLSYLSDRAYVFSPFIWASHHYPWPASQWSSLPASTPFGPTTPLNALVAGPLAGGPWSPGDPAPRSVSADWWDIVCPVAERFTLNTTSIKPFLGDLPGNEVLAAWDTAAARCVEVIPPDFDVDPLPQTFDLWIWGSERVLSLWEGFRSSPASVLLGPSPVVEGALARNSYLWAPRARVHAGAKAYDPPARMLAVHVRRGDYIAHCPNLAAWGSSYYGWAQLASLPDHFRRGADDTEEALRHCLPTAAQFAERIAVARDEYVGAGGGRVVDILYLLTNEEGEWLDELLAAVRVQGWATVATSRDLVLDPEQEEVGMAVDMEIARRAAVFLGNGWSSFTSNVVHQRLVDGKEPISIRMT
ncbi:hypothetical protein DFH07DRAFT_865639 [Mycena maculata]|uniref:Uncharacterized protein n=1 Tax=Mycena maculata TaxID=230809 RepID=A0AAD7NVF9_9AGAR|nr:hypothetical protein DFH07DRAFT_865639 [Mycena maculata]